MSSVASKTIKVLAGTGVPGDGGDGGPADKAELSLPVAMCLDDLGNVYIADANTFSVRCIAASTGVISTVAGGWDDCEQAWDPDMMMDDCIASSADGACATDAPLDVADLAFGKKKLYLAMPDEHRVRFVDMNTGKLHTLAGTGESGLSGDRGQALHAMLNEPSGIDLDRQGHMFVADSKNGLIRKVDLKSGRIDTVAGGGRQSPCLSKDAPAAMDAKITNPKRVLSFNQGDLVISSDDGVLLMKKASGLIRPLGEGLTDCDEFTMGVDAIDCDEDGNLYFASSMSQSLWILASGESSPRRIVGSGDLGQCENLDDLACVNLASPCGLAVASPKELYFVDAGVCRAYVVNL